MTKMNLHRQKSKPHHLNIFEMGNISTAVTKKDLAEAIADEFGVQYSPDGKRLLEAPRWGLKIDKVASYTVKPGVLCICDSAFDDCDFPECILLPDSVTSIGFSAFGGCRSLKSIAIPDSVTRIGAVAFEGCESLKEITIPDGVTHIGVAAFLGCSSLECIAIPNSITYIGYYIWRM